MHGGGTVFKNDVACAVCGEADGFMHSSRWAKQNNLSKLIIEGDCADDINHIYKPREDVTVIGFLLRACKTYVDDFDSCLGKWVPRNYNKAAGMLSKIAIANECNFSFNLDFSSEI